jgi:hypothetical protein
MKKTAVILLFFFSLTVVAQTTAFNTYQDTLIRICKNLYSSKKKTDEVKEKYNQQLLSTFEAVLNTPNSFDYPFDSLGILNYISLLYSPDKKFRIITWNLPKADGTYEYYGFIQEKYLQKTKKGLLKNQTTEVMQLYPLIDKSSEIKNPENTISDNKKWFGMLYYKIIEKKSKGKKYYTLLAWDGNDKLSCKKIIDVLTFDFNGTPRFGADIFNMQKKYPKRVIFEYSANCSMSLRYSSKKDSIVFDHLSPTSPQLEGQYQYYCNDMSYDGFGFKKGKWNYGTDLNAINDRDEKDKIYIDPRKPNNAKESNKIIERKKRTKNK